MAELFTALQLGCILEDAANRALKKQSSDIFSFPFLPVTSFEEVRQAVAQAELHALLVSICIPDHRAKVFFALPGQAGWGCGVFWCVFVA